MLLITGMLLVFAGFLTQRVGTCAVAAIDEIVAKRRANRLLGFLLCAATALVVMELLMLNDVPVLGMFTGHAISAMTAAGAVIFAIGVRLNGRCAMGTLASLAAGDLSSAVTITGMVVGAVTGIALIARIDGSMPAMTAVPSPLTALPASLVLVGAMGTAVGLALCIRRGLKHAPEPQFWSPITAMMLMGVTCGLLFAISPRWPYTSLIGDIARGHDRAIGERIGLTALLLVGSVWGAIRGRLFTWRWPRSIGAVMRALVSGAIMGLGAALVPGGNEAMLLTGLPLLLPALSLAYGLFLITLLALTALKARHQA